LPIIDALRLPIADARLPIADCRFLRLPTTDYRLPMAVAIISTSPGLVTSLAPRTVLVGGWSMKIPP
jgi:hypothetical protein